MSLFLEGIVMGLAIAVLAGPIFIVLISNTLQHGKTAGLLTGSGIWLSDIGYVILSYLFVNELKEIANSDSFEFYMGIIGGLILIGMGILFIIKKVSISGSDLDVETKKRSNIGFFLQGFLLNTFNPSSLLIWVTFMVGSIFQRQNNPLEVYYLFSGISLTIIVTDVLKVYLSHFIRNFLSENFFKFIIRSAGFALLAFGIYLLYKGVV